jgi:hypothetical protein
MHGFQTAEGWWFHLKVYYCMEVINLKWAFKT